MVARAPMDSQRARRPAGCPCRQERSCPSLPGCIPGCGPVAGQRWERIAGLIQNPGATRRGAPAVPSVPPRNDVSSGSGVRSRGDGDAGVAERRARRDGRRITVGGGSGAASAANGYITAFPRACALAPESVFHGRSIPFAAATCATMLGVGASCEGAWRGGAAPCRVAIRLTSSGSNWVREGVGARWCVFVGLWQSARSVWASSLGRTAVSGAPGGRPGSESEPRRSDSSSSLDSADLGSLPESVSNCNSPLSGLDGRSSQSSASSPAT